MARCGVRRDECPERALQLRLRMRTHALSLALFAAFAAAPTTALADPPAPPSPSGAKPELQVTSSAFKAGEAIPPKYTCDGTSTPPPLAWSAVPSGTRSIAIFVDDPDAPSGTFTHWLVTGISPTTTELRGGGPLPQGAVASKNGKGAAKYTGPCPPSGRHHYVFHVYALDTTVGEPPASRAELTQAIDGHVLAEGQLIGVYQKITPP
jgi:Raf kinase inhibitor-like YbhB/YbcL family protein